jgi:2-succinyl-6-hydroxy-2,4-cyclohexadiene-1-carboxylate synthase
MPRLLVNEVELHVEVAGQGPPLFAIHGFTGSATTWIPLVEAVGGFFTVVSVEMLGHGGSSCPEAPERYSMQHTVEDLLGVQDALGVRTAAWLGYSMGGRIALSVAAAAPERCGALLLESASPGIADEAERAQRAEADERLARWIETAGVEAFIDYWEDLPLFASQGKLHARVSDGLRTQRLSNQAMGLANSLRGLGAGVQPPCHDALPQLSMPVRCIAGGEDARYLLLARELASAVPHGEALIIPGAGHATHLEQPTTFNEAVLSFLRMHVGAADGARRGV